MNKSGIQKILDWLNHELLTLSFVTTIIGQQKILLCECCVSLVWFYLATSFTLYTYKIIYIEAKNGIDLLDLLGNIFCFWSPMNLMLFASVLTNNLPFLWNLFCVLALKHLMRWMNLIWRLCNFKRSENMEAFPSHIN